MREFIGDPPKLILNRPGKWRIDERHVMYFCRHCWHVGTFAVPYDVVKGMTVPQLKAYATDVHRAQPDSTCKNPEAVLCPNN